MNFNQYTIKAQEVVQHAVQIAQGKQQQVVETGHILKAILEEDPNTSQFLAKKLNVALPNVNTRLETIINGYPRVAGSANTEYLSNDLNATFQKAQSYLKEFNDEYVSVELLLVGLSAGKDSTAFSSPLKRSPPISISTGTRVPAGSATTPASSPACSARCRRCPSRPSPACRAPRSAAAPA